MFTSDSELMTEQWKDTSQMQAGFKMSFADKDYKPFG